MRELLEAISRKQNQMSAIQSDIAALERALKIVERPSDMDIPQSASAVRTRGRPSGASNKASNMTAAAEILRLRGRPAHIDEILDAFDGKVKKPSLVSSLARDVKSENPRFTKVGPNIFGLKVWENQKSIGSPLAESQGTHQGA